MMDDGEESTEVGEEDQAAPAEAKDSLSQAMVCAHREPAKPMYTSIALP